MQLKKREVERIFKKLDLKTKDNHHKNAYLYYKGRMVLKLRISHGRGDIPPPVVKKIINQFHLRNDQFLDLKNCPLQYEDYIAILKEKNKITP